LASAGLERALDRAVAYKEAGADFIFAEAVHNLDQYMQFSRATGLPILANITEFGQTPLFTLDELRDADVSIVLYPLSAFRAANKAASDVYDHIRKDGGQAAVLDQMQTREQLYRSIDYYAYESRLDQLFNKKT